MEFSGNVLDSDSQAPIQGVKISLLAEGVSIGSTYSTGEGQFDIPIGAENLPETVTCRIEKEGYQTWENSCSTRHGDVALGPIPLSPHKKEPPPPSPSPPPRKLNWKKPAAILTILLLISYGVYLIPQDVIPPDAPTVVTPPTPPPDSTPPIVPIVVTPPQVVTEWPVILEFSADPLTITLSPENEFDINLSWRVSRAKDLFLTAAHYPENDNPKLLNLKRPLDLQEPSIEYPIKNQWGKITFKLIAENTPVDGEPRTATREVSVEVRR